MSITNLNRGQLKLLLALVLTSVIIINTAHIVSAIPNPTGYMVNDWAHLLTYDEEDDLESACRYIEEQTTVEVYIVTTDDLEGEEFNRYS